MAKIAVLVLNQASVETARRLMVALPGAVLYGSAKRTTGVDVSFEHFKPTVQELFAQDVPIVGLCAAGILIRSLAPVLGNKQHEPAVIAVASDGSAVVPLLGGLHGANELAGSIATALSITPAITTTGDLLFRTALLSPPAGYVLANPDAGKQFLADCIAGEAVCIEGDAPWLVGSSLPVSDTARLKILVSDRLWRKRSYRSSDIPLNTLVYHPKSLVLGIQRGEGSMEYPHPFDSLRAAPSPLPSGERGQETSLLDLVYFSDSGKNQDSAPAPLLPPWEKGLGDEGLLLAAIESLFSEYSLSLLSLAGIVTTKEFAGDEGIRSISHHYKTPLRICESLALSELNEVIQKDLGGYRLTLYQSTAPVDIQQIGQPLGKLWVVGTGPGSAAWLTPEVKAVLENTTDWVGYTTYLNQAEPWRRRQQRHDSDNRVELDRARLALNLAAEGRSVAVVSSGDPGIYAMAAAVLEAIDRDRNPDWDRVDLQICPGVSAMQAAAALVGAPLGHDFCVISLSDILKPWAEIERRLELAAQGDFVIALYNPISSQRTWQLDKAIELLLRHRSAAVPVILAKDVGRPGQRIVTKSLGTLVGSDADMRTAILIGSSKTRTIQQPHQKTWIYTPRHYE
jgi:cobalt-precorrin 5A hydrolase / precorrin-3B C17-methyltransferase